MNLKTYRITHNISQAEAAKQLGVSSQSISNYETGRSRPSISVRKKIDVWSGGMVQLNSLESGKRE